MPLFSTFRDATAALWHMWELALTAQPLLVLGETPAQCSHAVLAISRCHRTCGCSAALSSLTCWLRACSLIAPVPYRADFRPYITMYDNDFKEVCPAHVRVPARGTSPHPARAATGVGPPRPRGGGVRADRSHQPLFPQGMRCLARARARRARQIRNSYDCAARRRCAGGPTCSRCPPRKCWREVRAARCAARAVALTAVTVAAKSGIKEKSSREMRKYSHTVP